MVVCEFLNYKDRSDVLLNCKTETFPSLDAQARIAPSSYGAHAIELTAQSSAPVTVRQPGNSPLAL